MKKLFNAFTPFLLGIFTSAIILGGDCGCCKTVDVIEPIDVITTVHASEPTFEEVVLDAPVEVLPEEVDTTPVPIEEQEPSYISVSDKEIDLLALVTMAEAEGESEEGKRLVISTILNRVDHSRFPNSITEVIYQKNQFTSMHNGRSKRCYVKDDIRQLVVEEIQNRTNVDVIFFTAGRYSKYGTPLFVEGNHYFSSY